MYDALSQFVGRLHPLVIHFPVGLLLSAALIEGYRLLRGRSGASSALLFCLGIGALGAWMAVGSGWLNAAFEGQADGRVFWHRWLGVASAGLGTLAFWAVSMREARPAVRPWSSTLVLLTGISVSIGGHLGGELSYGKGYLLEVFEVSESALVQTEQPAPAKTLSDSLSDTPSDSLSDSLSETQRQFFDRVHPIFATRCISCHGPEKRRGRYRLDSALEALAASPGSGLPRITLGDAEGSLLYQLVISQDEEEVMPAKGERLGSEQLAALGQWIDAGAPWPEGFVIAALAASSAPVLPVTLEAETIVQPEDVPVEETGPSEDFFEAVRAWQALGAHLAPLAEGSEEWELDCSMLGADFDVSRLAGLARLGSHLTRLSLARSACTDADLESLAGLERLQSLNLSQTEISDAGLLVIKDLRDLRSLNLYGTKLTDAGLMIVAGLPNLERFFLWQTEVSAAGLANLAALRPELSIQAERLAAPTAEPAAEGEE